MNPIDIIKRNEKYASGYLNTLVDKQRHAKELCFKYKNASIDEREGILKELFGTYNNSVNIEPSFHCDYGLNIHFHGFALLNYNCVILDTSPVNIGNGVFIAPGVCIACSEHAIDPIQRSQVIGTSAPITIEDNVWIGANTTVCGGVTIGSNSVIGAGSVVNHDIPSGVVAAGVPCKVIRKISDKDKIDSSEILF